MSFATRRIYGDCEHDGECPERTIAPCKECLRFDIELENYVSYPCPTIQAIQNHLGSAS